MTENETTAQVTTAQDSGNTTPSSFRARAFLFTLNQIDKYDELKELITKLKSNDYFLAAQEKAPTTGHEHIHIYAHFESSYKLNQKILDVGAHIDICKGSPKQNIAYVKKDGNILDEIGDEPTQGQMHTVKDLKEIKDPNFLYWTEYNTWNKIHSKPQKIKVGEWRKDIKVYYIWGESKTGKSDRIEEIMKKHNIDEFDEVKHVNDFWDGVVDGKGCCVYDDWRSSHMKASEFINFIDYRSHNLNVKGGSIRNNYNLIIISTTQNPDEIYDSLGDEPKKQWLRRMEIFHTVDDGRDVKLPDDCI